MGLAPSRIVDEGWHALLLHSAVYADLCASLGGAFVHHHPGYDPTNYDPEILNRTRAAITAMGWDPEEWTNPRYAELVAAWRRAQRPESRDPEPKPVRGFVVPSKG